MPPFDLPRVVISGVKEKIDSLVVQADRLYLGSSLGNLHIYGLNQSSTEGKDSPVQLLEIKKSLVRRSIEQLGFIKDVNSLVVLSEATVTLFPLPSLFPPTPLLKAKAAFSFGIHSSVQQLYENGKSTSSEQPDFGKANTKPIPTLVTHLTVGCRRKVVLYSWKDGEAQEVKEVALPHSARSITFTTPDTACFAYSPTEYAIFTISTMSAVDIATPLPATTSSTAMGALTGLTGYMTLGLMAKAKPTAVTVGDSEVLIVKDGEGYFVGPDAKLSRPATIEWPAPPEELAVVKPYIFSVLPAGTVPAPQTEPPASSTTTAQLTQPSFIPTSVLQIRSSLSLHVSQTIPFPFNATRSASTATNPHPPIPNATLRLLTTSTSAKSPLFLLTTPSDRTVAAAEGSTIWQFTIKPWAEQIDELVLAGHYSDALALLDTLDEAVLPDKSQRRTRVRALNAVAQFCAGKFDAAIDTFIELDFNPAKVVALFPEPVAGRLCVPQENWIPLYGGPVPVGDDATPSIHSTESDKDKATHETRAASDLLDNLAATGSLRNRIQKSTFGMLIPGGSTKDDDASSVTSTNRRFVLHDDLHRSVESLVHFLTDRRPKLGHSLEAVKITPQNQTQKYPPLSKTSIEELFALPDAPLSTLTPEQLLRYAQIVDTALYKSYLIIRPSLLSSLCRIANWCEVSEVEEDLRARKKYSELRDLYHGKGMHAKALDLLHEISKEETDVEDKLDPSIRYLQKLGPEHLSQIFESARWIFSTDKDMAFQIFTSEDVELPRQQVADYLEKIDPKLCVRYLEYILMEKQEESPSFHDRLAELYFNLTISAKKRGDETNRQDMHAKLLKFVDTNDRFSIDRLYGVLSSTELFEARAILLGRMGRHDQALELYVYRVQDYQKAEDYCKRVYQASGDASGVFLTLLRIYLRPTDQTNADLLHPALDLISRHSPRLDSVETLQLLPPLVTAHDIRAFLVDALRAPVFDTRVLRQISRARNDQLSRKLVSLQSRRVKVTDTRICPQCHKRLGNSVIAVHSPRGEVTHYQCREPFARKLNEARH